MLSPIIVALDFSNQADALSIVNQLHCQQCAVKIGKELFTATGPGLIQQLIQMHFKIFLDLKFHDIPSTTSKAVVAAAKLGVWMVNVHASGGFEMMHACRQALDDLNLESPPLLIAVTILTSMDQDALRSIGIQNSVEDQVLHLAQLAKMSGMDGVVCSAHEVSNIKAVCGQDFLTVTPGVRSITEQHVDQKRVMTPIEALEQGANYLVMGREITQSNHPKQTLSHLIDQVSHKI
ncbi:MAG: orotidine-5'-phosphate decarboxylase [Endozoicomonadaceae bacterium]|nr:orotidine-5'-phosphate decarboxylase [Endozoicomonadaceae bacterium]